MPHDIKECPFVPGFGHPAHWRIADTTFAALFAVCHRLDAALDNLCRAGYRLVGEDSFKLAMVDLGILTKTALGELVLLVGNGYGVGALKITRTMMDYAINATYLVGHPEEQENYLGWQAVEEMRLLEFRRREKLAIPQAPDQVKKIEDDYGRVKERYCNSDGKRRGSWSRKSLAQRTAEAGWGEHYPLIYPLMSEVVHGTVSAGRFQLHREAGKGRYDLPPSLAQCELPLTTGCFFGLLFLRALHQLFEVDSEPPGVEVWNQWKATWAHVAPRA